MTTTDSPSWRLVFGRDILLVFAALVALSAVVSGGTVFSYLAIAAASAIRNLHAQWLGSGALFYLLVGVFFLFEAALLAGLYRGVRRLLG